MAGSFLKGHLRRLLFHGFDAAGAYAHALAVHQFALEVYFVTALGRDFRVAARLAGNRSTEAAITDFTHNIGGCRYSGDLSVKMIR